MEPGDTFLVHRSLSLPVCQELKLFQALGDIPNLHGFMDGPDEVGPLLKPLVLGILNNSLGIFFILTQQQWLFAIVAPEFGDRDNLDSLSELVVKNRDMAMAMRGCGGCR